MSNGDTVEPLTLPILHSGVSSYEPEASLLGRGLKLMPSSAIPLEHGRRSQQLP